MTMSNPPATASFAHKPAVYCKGCGARLLKPSYDLDCGFCRIEKRQKLEKVSRRAA